MTATGLRAEARRKAEAFTGRGAPPPPPPQTERPATPRPGVADEAALLSSRRELGWRSGILVEAYRQGVHASRLTGRSSAFAGHKTYAPGDDPRHLDWHVLARLDRLCVRQHEAETHLRAHVLVDASGSMAYRSENAPRSKGDHAALLAAALSRILLGQGDACGLTVLRDAGRGDPLRLEAAGGRSQADRLVAALETSRPEDPRRPEPGGRAEPGRETTVAAALTALLPTLRRRGLVVIFTDGFEDPAALGTALGLLRAGGHEAVLAQVVDPQELAFRFTGRSRFRDLETGVRLPLSPKLVRPRYLAALEAHQTILTDACRGSGVHHALCVTDRSAFETLFELARGRGGDTAGGARR